MDRITEEIILGIVFFLFFAIAASPFIGGGDTLIYLSGANGIFEGKGYVDASTPFELPITIYPPLFSSLLAPFFIFGGNAILAAKIFIALLAAISLIIVKRLLEQFIDKNLSLLLTAATGLSLVFYWYATKILSEIPFLFFSLASLYFFLRATEKGPDANTFSNEGFFHKTYFAISLIFLVLSFYTRTIGVTLAAAFAVALIAKKQHKHFAIMSVVFILAALAWFSYAGSIAIPGSDSYIDQFLRKDVGNPESGGATFSDIVLRVFGNFVFYFFSSIPETVFSPLQALAYLFGRTALMPVSVLLLLVLIIGVRVFTEKNPKHIFLLYASIYLLFLLFWPYVDESATNRFLLPVLPMLLLFFIVGIQKVSEFGPINKIYSNKFSFAAFALIFICLASIVADGYYIYTLEKREYANSYKDLEDVSAWLKESAIPGSTVYSNEWQRIYFLSGVKGYASPVHLKKAELREFLEKNNFTYIVLLNLDNPKEAEYWPEKLFLQELYAGKEVYTVKSGNVVVYRIS